MQIANDENSVFPLLASMHKGSNDEIPSLNIFKHENSKSVTLALRSLAGVWTVLITTLYKFTFPGWKTVEIDYQEENSKNHNKNAENCSRTSIYHPTKYEPNVLE